MHVVIGAAVVIDPDYDNIYFYGDKPRDQITANDGAYYRFEKDVGVYESVDCNIT